MNEEDNKRVNELHGNKPMDWDEFQADMKKLFGKSWVVTQAPVKYELKTRAH